MVMTQGLLTHACVQKIPCVFQISVPNLGYLQGNIGQEVSECVAVDVLSHAH